MLIFVRAWILLSAVLVGGGWILSALHQLNRVGYLAVFGLALLFAGWTWRNNPPPTGALRRQWHKIRHRFRRSMPRLFLVLVLLSLAAGLLYCPYNGDSDSYRIPRVFHWLGHEQWHWMHTQDIRMNIAGAGYEWLSAPLLLFTGGDRFIFLINWVSYLLLPGLIYSVFLRLGVRRTVAWWWMWLLPAGWCYVWQAQSTNNDSFAVIYALASVDFALRARPSQRVTDWWLALLAAALLTGAKQTCLPLALVSLVALGPGLRPLCARPLPTLCVLAFSLLISVLPLSVFNFLHTGNAMGISATDPHWTGTVLDSPFWGVVGNTFCLTVQNLKPPLFPWAAAWNAAMQHFVQTPFGSHFKSFEFFGYLDHAATDESSGLGLFLCLILLLSVGCATRCGWRSAGRRLFWSAVQKSRERRFWTRFRSRGIVEFKNACLSGLTHTFGLPGAASRDRLIRLLWLAPWAALLVFMAKTGTYENARQLASYYVFLCPLLLLAPGHSRLVRQRWWRRLAVTVSLATAVMVAASRTCPLFPAQTILSWLHDRHPHSQAIAHVLSSYSCHNVALIERHAFQFQLPLDEKVLGYYTSLLGGAEPGFWQPFGIRQVERILPGDPVVYIRSLNIHYIVVDEEELISTRQSLDDWLRDHAAEKVSQVEFTLQWGAPPQHLYLTRLE